MAVTVLTFFMFTMMFLTYDFYKVKENTTKSYQELSGFNVFIYPQFFNVFFKFPLNMLINTSVPQPVFSSVRQV